MPTDRYLSTLIRAFVVAAMATAATAVAIVTAAPAQALICTATWAGPANGNWATATNWSPNQIPTSGSEVCINTAGGPYIPANYAAAADNLDVSGTSIHLNGRLTASTASLSAVSLNGSGTLSVTTQYPGVLLSGVQASGSIKIKTDTQAGVYVTGTRNMCGGQLALCLNGTSTLTTGGVQLDGNVGGSTTVVSPVGSVGLVGPTLSNEVSIEVSASSVGGAVAGANLRLDKWDQLTPDGTLTGEIHLDGSTLAVPYPVLTVDAKVTVLQRSDARTFAGPDAFQTTTTMTRQAEGSTIVLPRTVRPAGGVLTIDSVGADYNPTITFAPGPNPVTIEGTVQNNGDLKVTSDLIADGFVGNGTSTTVGAIVTVPTAAFHSGYVFAGGRLTASGGVSFDGTATLIGYARGRDHTCSTIDADVTMTGGSQLQAQLGSQGSPCPMFTSTGSFTLPSTLTVYGKIKAGTTVTLVHAAGGLQGRFLTLTGVPYTATITYTTTDVSLTY